MEYPEWKGIKESSSPDPDSTEDNLKVKSLDKRVLFKY